MKRIEITDKFAKWAVDQVANKYPELDFIGDLDEDAEIEVRTNNPNGFNGYVNIFEFILAHKIPNKEFDKLLIIYNDESGDDMGFEYVVN